MPTTGIRMSAVSTRRWMPQHRWAGRWLICAPTGAWCSRSSDGVATTMPRGNWVGSLARIGRAGMVPEDAPQPPGGAASSPAADVNAANNPLTPEVTVNLQDYFLPALNRLGNRPANQVLLRGAAPSDAFGVPQLIRFTLPVATPPIFRGSRDRAWRSYAVRSCGIPTGGRWCSVPAHCWLRRRRRAATPAPENGKRERPAWPSRRSTWGLLAALVTYQHSFAGDGSRPARRRS